MVAVNSKNVVSRGIHWLNIISSIRTYGHNVIAPRYSVLCGTYLVNSNGNLAFRCGPVLPLL